MAGKVIDRDTGFDRFFQRWRRIVASARKDQAHVAVGIQGDEAGDEHDTEKGTITNLALMIIHEFGAPAAGIPSRSVIRSTVDKFRRKYEKMLRDEGGRVLKGAPLKQALFVLGETARADMIRRIENMEIKQDLKPATKRRRGDEGPALWDDGLLKDAITSVVKA